MKVLLVRTTNGVSGTETHNIYLFRELQKKKDISVHVLTNHKPFLKRLKKNHIPSSLIFFPIKEVGTNREIIMSALWFLPMLILYLIKIKQLERGKKFDTIVLESMTEKLFLSPYLKLLGYRVIWIEQGPLYRTGRSQIVKHLYTYKSKWPDTILAVSNDTKNDLIKGGVETSKITVVYIGMNTIASLREVLKSKKTWVIGFLGNVTEEKGIKEFLEAIKPIIQTPAYAEVCIIGGGELLRWAKAYVKTITIKINLVKRNASTRNMMKNDVIKRNMIKNRIEFTGHVENPEKYLKKIDILYFPTRHQEGLSLAILEALSLGKIVVARDIGGNRELVVDGKTGFLFHTDDEGRRILVNIVNDKLSVSGIRKNALLHMRKYFSLQTQLPKFIEIFHG